MPGMSKGKVSFEMNLIEQLIINVETKVGIKIMSLQLIDV